MSGVVAASVPPPHRTWPGPRSSQPSGFEDAPFQDSDRIAWDVLEGPTHSQLETTVCPGPAGTTAITGTQIVHVDV